MSLIVGFFVGGRGTRLGGIVKGNLRAPNGQRLLERLVGTCRQALGDVPLVLVGDATEHADLGLLSIPDAPAGVGPLGGLRALLLHAGARGATHALALATDLPSLGTGLVERLAREAPGAELLAPREGAVFHVLAARWKTSALGAVEETLATGDRSLQRVAARLGVGAAALELDDRELAELRDWDTKEDVERG